jgi:hypothetical protein
MGHQVWFTQLAPDELDQALTYMDRQWERQGGPTDRPDQHEEPDAFGEWMERLDETARPTAHLHKYWGGIQFLLDAARIPIDVYDNGFYLDSDGTCAWTHEEVARAAELLRATPFDRLAGEFDPRRLIDENVYPVAFWDREGTLETLRGIYEELVAFFEATAGSGAAAIKRSSF